MKARILLAEDNRDVAAIMTILLQDMGYTVLVANDGVEAIQSAIDLHPDLVVLDMMMPKMNGFQAAAQLRQYTETKTIPILAATALAGSEERRKCLASGCDDYITKPYTPRNLAAAIERLLQKRLAEQPRSLGDKVRHIDSIEEL